MKKLFIFYVTALSGVMTFSSCSKEVFNENDIEEAQPLSSLQIQTRAEGDCLSGRIWIFSGSDFVGMLSTDETTHQVQAKLQAGTYDVYAVGSPDLSLFSLPEGEDVTPESQVMCSGEAMGDLFIKHEQLELTDGQAKDLEILLERKVVYFSNITVRQVPAEVTKVELSISPLYNAVCLNGDYADPTGTYKVELSHNEETNVWEATPNHYSFPSKGITTITLSITKDGTAKNYTFKPQEELLANHRYTLTATYTEPQGATLTAQLIEAAWDTDKAISFDFDEKNASTDETDSDDTDPSDTSQSEPPVAGSTYKGCYVVSVDTENKKAVLLSTTEQSKFTDATAVYNALNTWPTTEGVTGSWRIPTIEEGRIFLININIINLGQGGNAYYHCLNNNAIYDVHVQSYPNQGKNTIEEENNTTFRPSAILRPVIDITY